jgi:hypothetical protein
MGSVYPSDAVDVRFLFEFGLATGFIHHLPFKLAAGSVDVVTSCSPDHG